MKKRSLFALFVVILALGACQSKKSEKNVATTHSVVVVSDGLRFCESTYPYNEGILIANFGTEVLNPLNQEGKGYIAYCKDGKTEVMIPADGHLSGPKGMFIKEGYLFICDVNKIVVYNLEALKDAPQTIAFPEGDLFVNDLVASGNTLFASVTNTGRIYSIDIANPAIVGTLQPVKWLDIIGPNGLLIDNETMYVASYPADGTTTDANVIYRISDLAQPVAEPFFTTPGQYDGIALSADKKTLYVSNWTPAGVTAICMETLKATPVEVDNEVVGAADMTLLNGKLYIPDLPNSRVVCVSVEN